MIVNLKAMTDQELLDRITQIQKKLMYASRFSSDPNLVYSLQQMAEDCMRESSERHQRRTFELINARQPVECSLTSDGNIKIEKTNGKPVKDALKRENATRVMRSAKPVKE